MESNIIKRERVQVAKTGAAAALARNADTGCAARAPKVQAVSAGGHVHAIEVTCACGEVMLVELDYPERSAEAQR